MAEISYAQADSEDFSSGDYEWHYMLLKLPNQSINEDLSHKRENTNYQHVIEDRFMMPNEGCYWHKMACYYGVTEG
jgi:hypothetical protein